jgi:hypothetical protein
LISEHAQYGLGITTNWRPGTGDQVGLSLTAGINMKKPASEAKITDQKTFELAQLFKLEDILRAAGIKFEQIA